MIAIILPYHTYNHSIGSLWLGGQLEPTVGAVRVALEPRRHAVPVEAMLAGQNLDLFSYIPQTIPS